MAEIQNTAGQPPGKIRSKKMSTRIDFTPMVDLGFLLITFFMLTTTLSKPQVMALVMPDKAPDTNSEVPESKILTLLLGANDKIYWYEGISNARLDSTGYGAGGLRQVILDKMSRVQEKWGVENYRDMKTQTPKNGSYLNVLIKPTTESRYQNLVDALDEMAICRVRYYMILDISTQENDFIKNPANRLNFTAEQQRQASIR
ncbi:MAG TPA: biopolymer transporter ExbD [Saprospiraceae bacterium]|nr:biopolymer transporter ExbD [Saprospiraceae bacterium]